MSPEESVDWRLTGGALAFAVAVALATWALTIDLYGWDLEADVGWPNKMSWHASVEIPVTVTDDDAEPIDGATVELGYVPRSSDGESPPAAFAPAGWGRADRLAEHYDEFTSIADGETDAAGDAWLEAPAGRVLDERGFQDSDPSQATLVVRVRHDGTETARFADVPLQKRARLALTTDRPLYRPGDTVRLRGLALDAGTGGPYAPATTDAGAAAHLQIEGPEGTTLLRENPLVSDHGVVDHAFRLADEPRHGTYRATLTLADAETTRTFDVRPYEKPNFEVSLEAEVTDDDSRITGTVAAEYIYGEPVADAAVTLRALSSSENTPTRETRLDADGRAEFDLHNGELAAAAAESGLVARVEAPSGRIRQMTRRLGADDSDLQVAVSPRNTTRFRARRSNPSVVVVRRGDGRPLADARVTLQRESSRPVVASKLRTDERGRANFEWRPRRSEGSLRARITTSEGREAVESLEVSTAGSDATLLVPETPTPRVGESLDFELDIVEDRALPEHVPVLAFHDGVPVAATEISRTPGSEGDETAEGSIELDRRARGLTYLLALDGDYHIDGWTALWVRDARGAGVDIDVAGDDHHPGETATVSLAHRTGSASPDAADAAATTFGVWAVDEALYNLEEQADLPLLDLLHQPADAAEAASRARRALEQTDRLDTDSTRGLLEATRLNHAAGTPQLSSDRIIMGLDDALDEERRESWALAWSLLLLVVALGLLAAASRTLWKEFDWDELGWTQFLRTLGANVGLTGGWFLLGMWLQEPALYIILGIGGLAALGAIADALFVTAGSAYTRWLGTFVLVIGVTAALIVSLSFAPHATPLQNCALFAAALGTLTLAAHFIGWTALFWHRDRLLSAGHSLVLSTFLSLFGVLSVVAQQQYDRHKLRSSADSGSDRSMETRRQAETNAGPGKADEASPDVRDAFPDTMLWRPEITGEDGRAEIDVELPDSITTWRLQAIAHTDDGEVARGTEKLEVDRPFFADLDLPAELRRGDEVAIPVTLVDNRPEPDAPMSATIEAETSGAITVERRRVQREVPAGGRTVVDLEMTAADTGEGALTVEATTDGAGTDTELRDAVRRSTTVVAPGRQHIRARSSIVGEGWSPTLEIPGSARTAEARVELLPDRLAVALEGVGSMLERPHGCFEQTTSAAFPNASILGALDEIEPEAWSGGPAEWEELRARAERLVRQGFQRLSTFQNRTGGFGPFRSRASEVTTTAYGVLQLGTMARTIESLSADRRLREATSWLADRQRDDGTWTAPTVSDLQTTALVVWALGVAPSTDEPDLTAGAVEGLADLLDTREAGPLARAMAANALLAVDESARAKKLLEGLHTTVRRDSGARYWKATSRAWTGERNKSADLLATTLAARAMIRAELHPTLVRGATDYIATERGPGGGWPTTQTTVWALDLYGRLAGGSDEPTRLEVTADGEPIARPGANPDGSVRIIPGRTPRKQLGPVQLDAGEHELAISPDRETATLAQVTAEYTVPWDSPAARTDDAPLAVETTLATRRPDAGERVRVDVTVENRLDSRVGSTIARLPVPPGGWADTLALQERVEQGALNRIEQTPTHVVAYLPALEAGESTTLEYTVVPRMPGEFRLPPATAYPYYNPRPRAAVSGGELEVGR